MPHSYSHVGLGERVSRHPLSLLKAKLQLRGFPWKKFTDKVDKNWVTLLLIKITWLCHIAFRDSTKQLLSRMQIWWLKISKNPFTNKAMHSVRVFTIHFLKLCFSFNNYASQLSLVHTKAYYTESAVTLRVQVASISMQGLLQFVINLPAVLHPLVSASCTGKSLKCTGMIAGKFDNFPISSHPVTPSRNPIFGTDHP